MLHHFRSFLSMLGDRPTSSTSRLGRLIRQISVRNIRKLAIFRKAPHKILFASAITASGFKCYSFDRGKPFIERNGPQWHRCRSDDSLICIIAEADLLHEQYKLDDLYQLLEPLKDSDDENIMWRYCRACIELANHKLNDLSGRRRGEILSSAVEIGERMTSYYPDSPNAHKWCALAHGGRVAVSNNPIEKVKYFRVIHAHMMEAHRLFREQGIEDPVLLHMIGYIYFHTAEFTDWQIKLTEALFGELPVKGCYITAQTFFLSAENGELISVSRVNLYVLGVTYYRMKDYVKAEMWLSKARDYQIQTAEDLEAKKNAEKMLAKIKKETAQNMAKK